MCTLEPPVIRLAVEHAVELLRLQGNAQSHARLVAKLIIALVIQEQKQLPPSVAAKWTRTFLAISGAAVESPTMKELGRLALTADERQMVLRFAAATAKRRDHDLAVMNQTRDRLSVSEDQGQRLVADAINSIAAMFVQRSLELRRVSR